MFPLNLLHRPSTPAGGCSCDSPTEQLAPSGRERGDTACSSCTLVQPGRGGRTAERGRGGPCCCCAANTQPLGPGCLEGERWSSGEGIALAGT